MAGTGPIYDKKYNSFGNSLSTSYWTGIKDRQSSLEKVDTNWPSNGSPSSASIPSSLLLPHFQKFLLRQPRSPPWNWTVKIKRKENIFNFIKKKNQLYVTAQVFFLNKKLNLYWNGFYWPKTSMFGDFFATDATRKKSPTRTRSWLVISLRWKVYVS